uniref:ABC transporter domain-containing protein n=1 Tax=Spumella elongata TaxID=89044 RepID=A0A7S3M955_9STRA|mmetsp:Transcript_41694/g.72353  ORF Transcript_41694/g.72353 Transcript_41694/m.72353 type:complete len:609 (+) Transcript_41694:186-2012(+)
MNGGEIEFKPLEMNEVDVETAERPQVYTPTCPANAPAVLTFSNIVVTKRGGNKKKLLNNVSGSITGGLWAIMGSSGSGKTTLLSTIALRLNTSVMAVEGDIRLNGREYDAAVLKSMSAYVMQDDLLHAELTVAETLHWAALLRMPLEKTDEERTIRIKEVIDLMGIDHCRDTIVGNTRRKGISGGERKRLCIAVELLNRPKLIFLDEPTSGLDSTTAYAVIKALKNLSVVGECTAVCTIHQPAPLTFALFDNLILMKQGEAVFQGMLVDSHNFLKTLGKPCPPYHNLADHLIEAIAPAEAGVGNSEKFVVPIDLGFGIEKFNFSDVEEAKSVLFQTKILCLRNFQQQIRNWDTWLMGMAATFLIAFFLSGGIWQDLGNDQTSITKIPSALFFTFVNQGVASSLQCINSFPSERAIMLRERQAGAYTTLAYFTAKTIVDTFVLMWQPILFSVIVYPMFGLQPDAKKFFTYMAFMILDSMAATALATAVTCICVTVELSTVVLSLFFEICRLYGGFFTSPAQLSDKYENWKFLDALSYIKYGFVGAALNQLDGLEFTCPAGTTCAITSGEQVEAQKGYDEYTMGFCAGVLVLYIFGCRIIAYLGLKFIKN